MFQVAEMRDMVRVPPSKFNLRLEQAVIEELNRKLSDKIMLNVGLCICVYDITNMEASYIYPGDGGSHTRTTFRFCVFRPCIEEIIEGVVEASSPLGLQVSITFFDGIFIKPENMASGSYYDETEKVWIWNYQDQHKMFMDIGHKIKFKVISERFVDTTPSGPDLAAVQQQTTHVTGDKSRTTDLPALITEKDPLTEVHPYTIYGSTDGCGLGMLKWWEDEDEEDEEGEEEDGAEGEEGEEEDGAEGEEGEEEDGAEGEEDGAEEEEGGQEDEEQSNPPTIPFSLLQM